MENLSPASKKHTSNEEENGSGKMLLWRIEHPLCKLSGCAQGYGDKDPVSCHDIAPPSSTKLTYVERLPPYTTWIFLDRYGGVFCLCCSIVIFGTFIRSFNWEILSVFLLSEICNTQYRNQRMADDQSVVGKRRIYYDQHGSEALICSDSEEDIPEREEEKREFTEGEDQFLK